MLHAKNDSSRLKRELSLLATKNPELRKLILDLYRWVEKELGKDVTMTMISRTKKEQDKIYGGTKRGKRSYDKKPWTSPHQWWHALDIRVKDPHNDDRIKDTYTLGEVKRIEKYLNDKWNRKNYYKWTAKCHTVKNQHGESLGAHFHIQFLKG